MPARRQNFRPILYSREGVRGAKPSGTYLQIVENRREGDKIKQRVIVTLGRLDELQSSGQLDSLLRSGARFAEAVMLLSARDKGDLPVVSSRRIGPALML